MQEQNIEKGITLVELFNMLFRNIFLIIAITVGISIIGIIYTFKFVEPTYVSSSDVMVQVDINSETQSGNPDISSTLRMVQTVSEFIKNPLVLDATIEDLNLEMTTAQLNKNLQVSSSTTSLFIKITYECNDPILAQQIVNSVINNASEIADANFEVLNGKIKQVGTAKEGTYSKPNKVLNTIISVLLGGVIGVVAALLLETFKNTVRNKKELELLITDYQVIGVIPELSNKGDKENV